jgi:D-3-phosphoglycerate dehydrogenase / 2-oxoglutarate reductase
VSSDLRPRVLCVFPLLDASQHAELERFARSVVCASAAESEIAEHIVTADALIARGPGPVTAAHIESAQRLRVIVAEGAGYEHIDVGAATRAGIPVVCGAGVGSAAVAEYVLGAMVMAHRRMRALHDRFLGDDLGEWADRLPLVRGTELTGSVLGIVGYGNIGRELARRAIAAYDVRVVALRSAGENRSAEGAGVEYAETLEDLLERSLTVSINVPRTPETLGLIGPREIDLIGPQGVLINASRGGIVDERALVRALTDGRLKAAVVDVFAEEPPSAELLRLLRSAPNLIATPHVAGATDVSQQRLSEAAVAAVRAALAGDQIPRVVNPAHAHAASRGTSTRRSGRTVVRCA